MKHKPVVRRLCCMKILRNGRHACFSPNHFSTLTILHHFFKGSKRIEYSSSVRSKMNVATKNLILFILLVTTTPSDCAWLSVCETACLAGSGTCAAVIAGASWYGFHPEGGLKDIQACLAKGSPSSRY